MPELPEVETVARDLRRHLLPTPAEPGDVARGPTIVGARVLWHRTLRAGDEDAFWEGVVGRRIEAVGRRGKQLVVDLSGGAFLTIHLKMTGQLFVVPASTASDAYLRLVLVLDDGRELRFRDIRKFGRIGLYLADDDPFDGVGPEPLDPRFTVREFRKRIRARRGRLKPLLVDQSFLAGVGNIYADEALWRRASIRCGPRARCDRPTKDGCIDTSRRPRRGGGATWLIDRRLHGARWGRVHAGAARRLPARPASPAHAAGDPSAASSSDPLHALLLVLSASAPRRARGGRGDPPHDVAAPGPGDERPPGAALDRSSRAREASDAPSDEERAARYRTERARKAAAARRRQHVPPRAMARQGPADVDPAPGGRGPRGRDVGHPRRHQRIDRRG